VATYLQAARSTRVVDFIKIQAGIRSNPSTTAGGVDNPAHTHPQQRLSLSPMILATSQTNHDNVDNLQAARSTYASEWCHYVAHKRCKSSACRKLLQHQDEQTASMWTAYLQAARPAYKSECQTNPTERAWHSNQLFHHCTISACR